MNPVSHQVYRIAGFVLVIEAAPPEDAELVESLLYRHGRWPVASIQVTNLARHLRAKGQLEEALEVLKRGILFFPLSPISWT